MTNTNKEIENYSIFLKEVFGVEAKSSVIAKKLKRINNFIDYILSEDQATTLRGVFGLNSQGEKKTLIQLSRESGHRSAANFRKQRAIELLQKTINRWYMLDILKIKSFKMSSSNVLSEKIKNFGFLERIQNQLSSKGIRTIGDLVSKTEEELREPFGYNDGHVLSEATISEIKDVLDELGLSIQNQSYVPKKNEGRRYPKKQIEYLKKRVESLERKLAVAKKKRP